MTVPISDRLSQLYVGNGTNLRFDFIFRVFNQESESGVVVRHRTSEGFVTIDPALYSVTLNQENLGGFIEFLEPPDSNTFFYIAGETPLDQLLDITNYDNFYPDAIERALDKLTALLQEWGTQLNQEKQERILADIKYDSLAMEREENLENRLISYINAVVGITNPNIFDGISDRMIITKDGRTQREFNESIPFWTDDYVNFKQETYLREEQIIDHADIENIKTKNELNAAVEAETFRAQAQEEVLNNRISAVGVGNKAYKTYADMNADKLNIPVNSKVTITNDATQANNGDWHWDGANFIKSFFDPLTQSKNYTDDKVMFIADSVTLKKTNDPTIIPLLADSVGKALVYYDTDEDKFVAGGLLESIFELISQLKKYEDDRYISVLTDSSGKILLGWDKLLDQPIGFEYSSSKQVKQYKYFTQKPVPAEINHILSYGESLSVGAAATTILSTSQPYLNITFDTGPKMNGLSATALKPLVEDFTSPAPDGGTNRGETHCSGTANFASLSLLKKGINPDKHVIFASTGGYGGAKISQLIKTAGVYPHLMTHINKARELNAGKSHKVLFVPFIIGTNDAFYETSYQDFKTVFLEVYADLNADIKAITGQTEDVVFGVCQISYGVKTQPQIAKALWDLTQEHTHFVFVTPTYHLPHVSDNTHFSNVGYKTMGGYLGRVYEQYISEGRYPDYIKPLSAHIENNKIIIKFDVPTSPLVIDSTTLAITTNAGFKVMSDATEIAIVSVTAADDTVILQLANTPSSVVQVRYALDYLGTGLTIKNATSGNLRDSSQDKVMIAGTEKHLYHVCPHFELTAFLDKGI